LVQRISKIDTFLTNITKRKRVKTQDNKIGDTKGDSKTGTTEIQRTTREYFESLYFNKLENLEEEQKFLDNCDLTKLNQDVIENLNIYDEH
jgi:hypothetical protein